MNNLVMNLDMWVIIAATIIICILYFLEKIIVNFNKRN